MSPSRDERLYLIDIVAACDKIIDWTSAVDRERFFADARTFDAVMRNLQVIGDAIRNISVETRDQHPHLPWARVIAFRNTIVHGYFGIDADIVWDTVTTHVPQLRADTFAVLRDLGDRT